MRTDKPITPPEASRELGIPLWRIRDSLARLQRKGVAIPRVGQYRLIDSALLKMIKDDLERLKAAREFIAESKAGKKGKS